MILCEAVAWGAPPLHGALELMLLTHLSPKILAKVQRQMPTIFEVHRAALQQAKLADDVETTWASRTKWAAALPRLQIGIRHNLNDDINLQLADAVSVTSSGVVIGPRTSDLREQNDRHFQLDVRALWSLNELAFSSDAVVVSRETRERHHDRMTVLHEIDQLVTQWQVLRAGQLAPVRQVSPALIQQQLAFVQAELDARTGGWFSLQVGGSP